MHRLSPDQFTAGWEPPAEVTAEATLIYAFRERDMILRNDGGVPTAREISRAFDVADLFAEAIYFGALHPSGGARQRHCYALRLPQTSAMPPGYRSERLRSLYAADFQPIGLPRRAIGVLDWAREHQFCGRCGLETVGAANDRSRQCPRCKARFYPRMSPAVIVAVHRGDELLLARGVRSSGNMFSVLAGFVEFGESLEECVMREVREEVGISLSGIEYFASQSWPHPNALMLGFRANYESGELKVDEQEIIEAGFYRRDALPPRRPGSYSIAHWLIEDFLRGGSPGSPPRVDFEREALSRF